MNNKGFTLIEIIGVLIVLSVISIVAIISIGAAINNSREQLNKDMIKTLKDSAITYTLNERNVLNCNNENTNCYAEFTVQTLIDNNFFLDNGNNCKRDAIIEITKMKVGSEYSYEFVIDNDICLGG